MMLRTTPNMGKQAVYVPCFVRSNYFILRSEKLFERRDFKKSLIKHQRMVVQNGGTHSLENTYRIRLFQFFHIVMYSCER